MKYQLTPEQKDIADTNDAHFAWGLILGGTIVGTIILIISLL